MKKNVLSLGIIVFVTAFFLSINAGLKKDVQPDIFMSNSIALAQNEGGGSGWWTCYASFFVKS